MKKLSYSTCFCLFIIIMIYIIPQSSSFNYTPGTIAMNVFVSARLMIIPALGLYVVGQKKFFLSTKNLIVYGIFIIIFFYKYVEYKTLDFAIIYMMLCIICFDFMYKQKLDFNIVNKFMKLSVVVQLCYFLIYTGKSGRNAGSWLDPNMAGYFCYLLMHYFFETKQKKLAILMLVLGILTYSRTFFIALLVYLFFEIVKIRKKLSIRLIIWGAFFLTCFISYLYTMNYYKFNSVPYNNSFSRLFSFIDESNYIRTSSNMVYFDNITFNHIFLGYFREEYLALQVSRIHVLPHNLILSIAVSFGLPITIIYIEHLCKIYPKEIIFHNIGYVFGLMVYNMFLGTSSYYGYDLILQLIIVKAVIGFQITYDDFNNSAKKNRKKIVFLRKVIRN